MSSEDRLCFEDVVAGYGKLKVINGLNLSVPRGVVCALLGRNGAGKTTLLRTALGFLRVREGRVTVLGEEAWASRYRLKDRIGFVAERQDLWPRMRGKELLALASRLYASWDEKQAETLVDRFGLDLSKRIGTYSRGMQVQLAEVVALSHRPELLILDEPVAGMDPVVRSELAEHVLQYVHDTGASVLYSTHLVDEVGSMADQVAFLHGGTVILQGPVEDVVNRYSRLLAVVDADTERAIERLHPVSVHRHEEVLVATFAISVEELQAAVKGSGVGVLEVRRPGLQELFIALLGEDNPHRDGSHAARRHLEVA